MINDERLAQLVYQSVEKSLLYVPIDRAEYGVLQGKQIQPASVDVRLSHDLRLYDKAIDWDMRRDGHYRVAAGECLLGSLVERVHVPNDMVGWIEGKSSIGRQFLKVHSAGFIDPGFHGDLTLEIKNESSYWEFELIPGMLIAQLRFAYLDAVVVRPYGSEEVGSHYQMQIGTTQARS